MMLKENVACKRKITYKYKEQESDDGSSGEDIGFLQKILQEPWN
jgi:hypothetical protein